MSVVEVTPVPTATRKRDLARLLRRPTARIGATIVIAFLLLTMSAPLIAPYDPFDQDLSSALTAPALDHPFGTDQYGRDVLSRVMVGSRTALLAILVADGIALIAGCAMGLVAGVYGEWADSAVMRVVDVLLAFPYLLLALIIVAALGPSLQIGRASWGGTV